MGFIKRIIKNALRDQTLPKRSSFENLTEEQLEAHLNIARYGDFWLTDAIRPSYDLQVVPTTGYRHDKYRDEQSGFYIPVLIAAASSEKLFDLFFDLLDPLGMEVDVVLETSHENENGRHRDLYRESIDLPVLKSVLCEYEDLLLNDGCTGIAVLNPRVPVEVQFDEHKLLIVYGHDLEEFERILQQHGVECREDMKFITEAEHVHSSSEEYYQKFCELQYRLGIDI